MVKTYSMELAGRTLKVEIGKVGKQANGCAFSQSYNHSETALLCSFLVFVKSSRTYQLSHECDS